MPDHVRRPWPRELEHLLADLRPRPDHEGSHFTEVDLSADEIRTFNLFEASARHDYVCFEHPATSQMCEGHLNTLVGLGAPQDRSRHVARVWISFCELHTGR